MSDKRTQCNRLISDLRTERDSYIRHWMDLNEYILPRSAKFFIQQGGKGDKRNQKIINNTPTLAARTLASGMMAGVTSPARPWFKLSTGNPDLDEQEDVKAWLHTVGVRMREVFTRSNLYNALPTVYADLGVYGTAAMAALEDDETIIRFQNFPIGSYAIANDERGKVDTIIREWQMTARQLVQMFGEQNCSEQVQRAVKENQNGEMWIEVAHVVKRNPDFNPDKLESKNKKYISYYMENGAAGSNAARTGDKFLRESGFNDFPVMVPRWSVSGENIYGDSPAMDALGDIKGLQVKEKRKAMMIDKGANPPMAAPSSLKNQRASLLPGDVTYLDTNQGQQKFEAVYEPNPTWLNALATDIQNDERRIKRAFFEDLFLMLSNMDRAQITATEVAERKEEKLLILGPVLDRLNDELLDPLIDRTFTIMVERSRPDWDAGLPGLIPVPPESMKDVDLKVEYTSVMAQALRMVGLGSIERFAGFVGNMAAVDPTVLDKWNRDATIDEYGEMIGLTPKIINSEETVAAVRKQRAAQQQMAQQMEMAEKGAKTAQALGATPAGGDTALAQIVQNMQGAQS